MSDFTTQIGDLLLTRFFFIKKDYFHFLSLLASASKSRNFCAQHKMSKKTSRCCPSYDNVDGKFEDLNKGMKMKRKTRETLLHSAHFSHLSEAEEQRWYGSECPSCFRVVVVKICKREIRKEIIAQPKCEEYERNKEIVQFVRFYQNNRWQTTSNLFQLGTRFGSSLQTRFTYTQPALKKQKPPHNDDNGNWHWLEFDLLIRQLFSVFVVVAYATGILCCVCMLFILIILWMSSHTESPSRCLHFACRKLQMIQTLCHSQQTLIIYNSVARRFHYGEHALAEF